MGAWPSVRGDDPCREGREPDGRGDHPEALRRLERDIAQENEEDRRQGRRQAEEERNGLVAVEEPTKALQADAPRGPVPQAGYNSVLA